MNVIQINPFTDDPPKAWMERHSVTENDLAMAREYAAAWLKPDCSPVPILQLASWLADVRVKTLREVSTWRTDDQPLPEDEAINAVFPTRSGRHDLYAEACRLVGARRSKFGLVELVNWLLHERR